MQRFSDFEILQYLSQSSGRLRSFLMEVPTHELRDALEEKEILEDQRYHQANNDNWFKKNVLDFNLHDVIKTCYNQKIINYFQYKLALEQSRLQNHPSFGMKLVRRYPQKYYVGQKSKHFNHAQEIEEYYGISKQSQNINESQNSDESSFNDIQKSQASQQQEEGESILQEEQVSNQFQYNQQDEQDFLVDDQIQESEQQDQIDQLQNKLKQIKKGKKQSHNSKNQSLVAQKKKKISKLSKSSPVKQTKIQKFTKGKINLKQQQNDQKSQQKDQQIEKYLIVDKAINQGRKTRGKRTAQKQEKNTLFYQILFETNNIYRRQKMVIESEQD